MLQERIFIKIILTRLGSDSKIGRLWGFQENLAYWPVSISQKSR